MNQTYGGYVIDEPARGNAPSAPAGNPAAGRILVVDDDDTVAEVVARYLRRDGHEVECVADGREALRRARANPPDLIVLDLMLPGLDGLEVCRRLRETSPVPIVMLTALGQETDRLVGLELGADDYVTKPFSPRELALRVRSVLRRARGSLAPAGAGVLTDDDLRVDVGAHEVSLAGAPLALTAREFDLLAFFLRHPRQAFTREQLLEQVWGWSFGDSSTVTVHVRRLREKIERDPTTPLRIVTVWGVGYRYEPAGQGGAA
ncbi:MAG: response regulator receiver protein [Actinomycetia bacterium]|nr:response regulator receiver protein [Actinomycetes bacterium]